MEDEFIIREVGISEEIIQKIVEFGFADVEVFHVLRFLSFDLGIIIQENLNAVKSFINIFLKNF